VVMNPFSTCGNQSPSFKRPGLADSLTRSPFLNRTPRNPWSARLREGNSSRPIHGLNPTPPHRTPG
jgi:hypothetical protein